jgi:hypothetical protein
VAEPSDPKLEPPPACPPNFARVGNQCIPLRGPLAGGPLKDPDRGPKFVPIDGTQETACIGGRVALNRCICPDNVQPRVSNGQMVCPSVGQAGAPGGTPCPQGTQFVNGACRVITTGSGSSPQPCPQGTQWINGACRIATTGGGTPPVAGIPTSGGASSTPECPTGKRPVNGVCRAITGNTPRTPSSGGALVCPKGEYPCRNNTACCGGGSDGTRAQDTCPAGWVPRASDGLCMFAGQSTGDTPSKRPASGSGVATANPCGSGQLLVNGTCRATTPSGTACPAHTVWVNGACRYRGATGGGGPTPTSARPIVCDAGMQLVNGACRPIATPSSSGGAVASSGSCPEGRRMINGYCSRGIPKKPAEPSSPQSVPR